MLDMMKCSLMAVIVSLFQLLALQACFASTTLSTECRKDCVVCMYRHNQLSEANSVTCILECEGNVDQQTLKRCWNVLSQDDLAALRGGGVEHTDKLTQNYDQLAPKKSADRLEDIGTDLIGKSVAPMIKRYGGFMKKALVAREEGAQRQASRETLNDDTRVSQLDEGSVGRGLPQSQPDFKLQGREQHKRYGGFMRRVGRPEWLDDRRRSEGLVKRLLGGSPDEEGTFWALV